MSKSIRKRIGLTISCVLALFVIISFIVSFICVVSVGSEYQQSIADSALDFSELTINADTAKEVFATRNINDEFVSVNNKLYTYQNRSKNVIERISVVVFSNSAGSYIYDTGGQTLGSRVDYDNYTESIKAELINGRNEIQRIESKQLTIYRPIRTVDDRLAGHIIVKLNQPFEYRFLPVLIAVFAGLVLLSVIIVFIIVIYLNKKIFRPIKRITDSTVYLSGDDSASEGKDTSVIFDTDRSDEIGQLSKALQKIFFDMNSGAEHLSQALYDANHDGMTQMLNKRCYHSMIEKFTKRESICIIYFDVNNLKLMNDTHGHESGDYVIKRAADYIREFIDKNDYCFRTGGDEFVLIMLDCSFRDIDHIVTHLDRDCPYLLNRESDTVKCALSYGFAYAKGEYVYDDLVAEAEANMYEKKTELKKQLNMPDR
ncbi:MAG TPA: GGDEF domain-containing protein [Ruminococcus flavefaciens]|nr:GGDEF domain-containing protein [Ruminococcus flavefaciens]